METRNSDDKDEMNVSYSQEKNIILSTSEHYLPPEEGAMISSLIVSGPLTILSHKNNHIDRVNDYRKTAQIMFSF